MKFVSTGVQGAEYDQVRDGLKVSYTIMGTAYPVYSVIRRRTFSYALDQRGCCGSGQIPY